MPGNQDYSPERMVDRAQIQDVMYRWCRAIDRQDFDAIRAVFHSDAIDSHGIYSGGIDGLIDWIRERHRTIPMSMHMIGNMLIEFADLDTAIVETYNMTVQRYPAEASASFAQLAGGVAGSGGGASDLIACCRYVDRFERRNGEWRVAERTVVFDSTMMFPVAAGAPKMSETWTQGKRGNHADFLYQVRAAAGIAARG